MAWELHARVLTLSLLVMLAPIATAVGPTQDDAGSGGDAGDVAVLAVPLPPGQHQGTLGLADVRDHFRIDAPAGHLLTLDVSPWVLAILTSPGGQEYVNTGPSIVAYADVPGVWQLSVERIVFTPMDLVEEVPYALGLGFTEPGGVVERGSDAPSEVTEVAWTGGTIVDITLRQSWALPMDRPAVWHWLSMEVVLEEESGPSDPIQGVLHGTSYWQDDSPRTAFTEVVPDEGVLVEATAAHYGTSLRLTIDGRQAVGGKARLITASDAPLHTSLHRVVVESQGVEGVAAGPVAGAHAWRAVDDASHTFTLGEGARLLFHPTTAPGEVVPPEGPRIDVPQGGYHLVDDAEPGAWTVALDAAPGPRGGHGFTAFGVEVPDLGIFS